MKGMLSCESLGISVSLVICLSHIRSLWSIRVHQHSQIKEDQDPGWSTGHLVSHTAWPVAPSLACLCFSRTPSKLPLTVEKNCSRIPWFNHRNMLYVYFDDHCRFRSKFNIFKNYENIAESFIKYWRLIMYSYLLCSLYLLAKKPFRLSHRDTTFSLFAGEVGKIWFWIKKLSNKLKTVLGQKKVWVNKRSQVLADDVLGWQQT